MELAGVNSIKFYENKGLSITYDGNGKVTNISNTGETIDFNECLNNPKFEFNLNGARNNNLLYDYILNGELNDIGVDSYEKLAYFYESIYGWIPEISLNNGEKILINDPFFGESEDLNTNVSHTYFLEIKPRALTNKKYLFFV